MTKSSATGGITWHELQRSLRDCTTEEQVQELIDAEKASEKPRLRWLMRMQGRLRVLRTERENQELRSTSKKGSQEEEE